MTYYRTFNDPQEEPDHEPETCPECGSESKEPSHFDSNEGVFYSRCLDCDNIYETF